MSTMGYVTTLTGAEDAANLSLDFEKQSYRIIEGGKLVNKNFPDIFTFQRSTTAGRINLRGLYETVAVDQPRFDYDPITKVLKGLLVEEQRTNIATFSENMRLWNRTRVSVIPNSTTSPDGKFRATKLVSSTVADWHYVSSPAISVATGTPHTISVYAKAAEWPRIRIGLLDTNVFSGSVTYDLTTGTRVAGTVGDITPVGDGWYRCTFTSTSKISGNSGMSINAVKAGETDANSAGDGVSGIYIWGGQIETATSYTSYIPNLEDFISRASTATYFDSKGILKTAGVNVARTNAYAYTPLGELKPIELLVETSSVNLIPHSTNFANSAWAAYSDSGATTATKVLPNRGISPSGAMDADLLVMGTANCLLTQNLAATPSLAYTMSVWMKGVVGGEKVRLEFRSVTSQGTSWAPPITLTKEWVRYTVSGLNTAVEGGRGFQFRKNAVDGGDQSFYIWGAQVEQSALFSSYIPTSPSFISRASTATYFDASGVMQTAPINTARADAYSRTGQPIGLLVESAGTNFVKNSRVFGSGWADTSNSPNKLVVTENALTAPDGTTTATLIEFPAKDASTTQTWNQQVGQLTAGALLAPSVWLRADRPTTMQIRKGDGVAGYEAVQVTTEWQRFESTPGVNSGTTFNFGIANPASLASTPFKLYAWGAQLEYGNFATSEIVTGSVAVTRAADVYTSVATTRASDVTTSTATTRAAETPAIPVGDWYNQPSGTLVIDAVQGLVGSQVANFAQLAGAVNYYGVRIFNSTVASAAIVRDTVDVNLQIMGRMNDRKRAVRVKAGDYAFSSGGSDVVKNTSTQVVTPTRLEVGSGTAFKLNGHVKSVMYYPVALTDTQLQLITA